MTSDYYGNIRTLLRFLTRDGEDGYAFATARHEGLIPAVNRELIQQAEEKRKRIEEVWVEPEEDKTFSETLRQALPEANALIVMGLDKPLQDDKDFVINLNFAREAINALGKPVLLWLNPESLTILSNQAADLFSQRRISTVQFEEAPEIVAPVPELERRFQEEYRSSEDYEKLRNRVNLLKKQLAEATESCIPRQRIARDIVLPLAETYSDLDLHEEALRLLEEYKDVWNNGDARELYKRGEILDEANRYSEAISCLENAKQILEAEKEDSELMADVHLALGDIQREIGFPDKALQHYERNLELREFVFNENASSDDSKNNLASSYNRIGGIYKSQGQLGIALEFFEKALQMREELHAANPLSENLKNNLASSYNRIGSIYESQGKLGKAMEFIEKALQMQEELHAANPLSESLKDNLAESYIDLGKIYEEQNKVNRASEFYDKALQMREELYLANPFSANLKGNLVWSYNKMGDVYELEGKLKKAIKYYEKSLQISEDLYKNNPLSEDLKYNLTASYNRMGGINLLQGNLRRALEFFEKDLQISEDLHATNPLSEKMKFGLSISYKRIAGLSLKAGKWPKSILYTWKSFICDWELCRHAGWERYKYDVGIGILGLFLAILFFPPIFPVVFWFYDKVDLLYKRLRYGPDK